jgi:hypothetical protein
MAAQGFVTKRHLRRGCRDESQGATTADPKSALGEETTLARFRRRCLQLLP